MSLKEHRLSTAERKALRARLTQRAMELRAEVHEGLQLQPTGRDESLDDAAIASVARDRQELDLVQEALARIDTEGYGYCLDCGVGIALERLRAEPFALRCVRCQDRVEGRMRA